MASGRKDFWRRFRREKMPGKISGDVLGVKRWPERFLAMFYVQKVGRNREIDANRIVAGGQFSALPIS